MTNPPELCEAARSICMEAGIDPDEPSGLAPDAPPRWEAYLPHARAAGAVFSTRFRALAEVARAAAMVSKDQIQAERLKARADALHEAADLTGHPRPSGTVVEFRRRP